MSCKWWRRSGIAGLILSVATAAGCGGGEPPPGTVERPGPAIPKDQGVLKQGSAGKKAVGKPGF
jgi:hypothetical protein